MNYTQQFFYLLDKQAERKLPFLAFFFLISSLFDVVGIGLVGLFLSLLTNFDLYIKKLSYLLTLSTFTITSNSFVIIIGVLIVVALVVKSIVALFSQQQIARFSQSLLTRLRLRLMSAYQMAPYSYHLEKNSALLLSRIQGNMDYFVYNTVMAMLNLISGLLIALAVTLFMFVLYPSSTACLILMFLLIAGVCDLYIKKKLLTDAKTVALVFGEIIKNVRCGLQGLLEIRVLGKEDYFLKGVNRTAEQYSKAFGRLTVLQQVPRYLIEAGVGIFIVILSLVYFEVDFNKGQLVPLLGMFAIAGVRLLPCVNQIISLINQIRSSSTHMSLIFNDLYELEQYPKKLTIQSASKVNKLSFTTIELRNIAYCYNNSPMPAINDISMTIQKGQAIGLIGASGAGKSTLVNIILGLIEPKHGGIYIDEKPLENLRGWLNNFAYIPQTIFLLDDTLVRNVALGISDEDINLAKVIEALNMAQLAEVIQDLPKGMQTVIGENGIRLSGGQRQRIALARAFYHNRDIIILDEATSALDQETEREVINIIHQLQGNKTLIVIAHRLSTVENCDVIYRLDKGRITSSGDFNKVVLNHKNEVMDV